VTIRTPTDWHHDGVTGRSDLESFYRRYNAACNAHAFDRLAEFVAPDVMVDGEPRGLAGYVDGLRAVVRAFPDYRWEIRRLLIDGDWIAGHFLDTGTHGGPAFGVAATGQAVRTQEFAFYRIEAGKIAEVWGTADDLDLLHQVRSHDTARPARYADPGGDAAGAGSVTLEVDGELFAVRPDGRGGTGYTWLSGPNEGYGFGESPARDRSPDEHRASIRAFLAQIDPATGYL
jgi:predicted ester cyclase